jgi:hypothetical protein
MAPGASEALARNRITCLRTNAAHIDLHGCHGAAVQIETLQHPWLAYARRQHPPRPRSSPALLRPAHPASLEGPPSALSSRPEGCETEQQRGDVDSAPLRRWRRLEQCHWYWTRLVRAEDVGIGFEYNQTLSALRQLAAAATRPAGHPEPVGAITIPNRSGVRSGHWEGCR